MHVFNVSSPKQQQALYRDGQQTTFLLNDLHVCEHVWMIKRCGCELAPPELPVLFHPSVRPYPTAPSLAFPLALALHVSLSADVYKTPPEA